MGGKLSNALIVLMIIIIFGLGAIYYMKVVYGDDYSKVIANLVNFEESEEKTESKVTNANTINEGTNENRLEIGEIPDNNSNNIYTYSESGYKYNNRYYYNGLAEYSKPIYDAIANNLENMKKRKLCNKYRL